MPQPLAGIRIKRQQRIGIQIVPQAVAAIEVKHRRPGRDIHNAALLIQRHPRPIVRGSCRLPRLRRPGLIPRFAGMRNRMKAPAQLSRAHIEGPHVPRRRRMRLRIPPSHNNQVLVDDPRCSQIDGLALIIPAQLFAQVDPPRLTEGCYRLARLRIQAIEKVHHPGKNASLLAIGPVRHPPRRLRPAHPGVKLPLQRPCRRVQRNNLLRRRIGIERPPHNQRIVLNPARLAGIERPRHLQQANVASIDLRQLGVVIAVSPAIVDRPVHSVLRHARHRRYR